MVTVRQQVATTHGHSSCSSRSGSANSTSMVSAALRYATAFQVRQTGTPSYRQRSYQHQIVRRFRPPGTFSSILESMTSASASTRPHKQRSKPSTPRSSMPFTPNGQQRAFTPALSGRAILLCGRQQGSSRFLLLLAWTLSTVGSRTQLHHARRSQASVTTSACGSRVATTAQRILPTACTTVQRDKPLPWRRNGTQCGHRPLRSSLNAA